MESTESRPLRPDPDVKTAKKRNHLEGDPCFKERQMSLKCMDENDYDRDKCFKQFENFKSCNGFWLEVMKQRRRDRIKPVVPPIEERDQIRKEFFNKNTWWKTNIGTVNALKPLKLFIIWLAFLVVIGLWMYLSVLWSNIRFNQDSR